MSILRLRNGDGAGFGVLLSLAVLYGLMSFLVYSAVHNKFVRPLAVDAPPDRFSEGRALQHLHVLAKDIDGRQEGREGLKQAAKYIKEQLETLRDRANPKFRIEIEENTVNGSFNMLFLGRSISLGYRGHTNVLMRMSSADSPEDASSVLVNAHFDSPLGSPGAGDCGSCVVSMLELARLIIDSAWIPPQPIIFLFNGAEELFMLGSHGFTTTHKWSNTVGAFINIEASGTGGPDLVCQSGPGSWTSFVYAKSALYPMANSAAQDVFNVIPGDTDYRIFAQDYNNIPGLDIIFLLGGYYYHTSYDTVERLLPGSLQARGENLFELVKGLVSSSTLLNASERLSLASAEEGSTDGAIFFDYLSWFMVYYPKGLAAWFHSFPVVLFLLLPFAFGSMKGQPSRFLFLCDIFKELLFHAISIIMGISVPVIFAVIRLVFTSHAMVWFAHPHLAFMMFVPCSLVGLLIPRFSEKHVSVAEENSVQNASNKELAEEARFWGAFGFYALFTLAYLLAGLGGGFLTFSVSVSLLVAWALSRLLGCYGFRSLRSLVTYVVLLTPCLTYVVYFGGFLAQFLIEKMGMVGSAPPPYGYYVQDVVAAAMVGVATGWSVGPLLPIIYHWLAKLSIIQFLVQLSVLSMAISSQFFPYSTEAPKRVVFQHAVVTSGSTQILNSTYDFVVVDSNSLSFLLKHSPKAADLLNYGSELSFEPTKEKWLGVYPVSYLFSKSMVFQTTNDDIMRQYRTFPHLYASKPQEVSDAGIRKVHLEFDLGSLKEVWVAVLNITGPLCRWSFSDNIVPAPETMDGGPPSHILRLSGASYEKWNFWLEANGSEPLRVDVAVVDQNLAKSTKKLKDSFPEWVDVTTYTNFMSSYVL